MKFLNSENATKKLNGQQFSTQELSLDRTQYFIERGVDEYPKDGSFYSEDLHYIFFDKGWNTGKHWFAEWKLTPWRMTRWGSHKAYDEEHLIPKKNQSGPTEVGGEVFDSPTDYLWELYEKQIYAISNSKKGGGIKVLDIRRSRRGELYLESVITYNSYEEYKR